MADGQRQPTPSLRNIILRALTDKQILILREVEQNEGTTITSLVNKLSRENKIPLSTLKLNARILKDLGLISNGSLGAQLTDGGRLVLSILGGDGA